MGVTSSPIDWYAARASGIVALVLLTVVVLVGLTLSGQLRLKAWPRFAVTDIHRYGGLLASIFLAVHVVTIALDSYTGFSIRGILVPFTASYRPIWTALGIVGFELLLAIGLTNRLKKRLPHRWWRRVHTLNFAVWGASVAHGIGAGTDTKASWMEAIYVGSVASVFGALAWRIGRRRMGAASNRSLALGSASAAGLAAALLVGLPTHKTPAPVRSAAPVTLALPASFRDTFTGSLTQQNGTTGAMLTVSGRGSGGRAVVLRADLVTQDGQSVSGTALQLLDVSSGTICSGTLGSVTAGGMTGSCTLPSGSSRTVSAAWQMSDRSVQGTLSVSGSASASTSGGSRLLESEE